MKRFYVAIPNDAGAVELYPMKQWLRQNSVEVPLGLDPITGTSHQLRDGLRRNGWTVQETEHDVRLIRPSDSDRVAQVAQVLGEDDEPTQPQEQVFALEHHLRDFLAENLETVRVDGRRVRLYVDPAGRDGTEYPTDVGFIDILAVDEDGGFVVFELKRASVADRAVGQLARYMGWVRHTIGRGKPVRGVIVARST
jgi:endonuclease